jgi:hypothetical protein
MIATDHFVFIHLQTCGDRFAKEFLLGLVPGARQIGNHVPRRMTPPSLSSLPALGMVRNPWSYYALWYSLNVGRPNPGTVFRVLSDNGALDFEQTVRNLLDLGEAGTRLSELSAALPPTFTGKGLNLPGFALESIRGSGLGFFSFLYRHMYDGPGVMQILRVERLREELLPTLLVMGQHTNAAMRAYVEECASREDATLSRPAAPSRQDAAEGDYTRLYSNELRDLVAERDAQLIARYGYRFGE